MSKNLVNLKIPKFENLKILPNYTCVAKQPNVFVLSQLNYLIIKNVCFNYLQIFKLINFQI